MILIELISVIIINQEVKQVDFVYVLNDFLSTIKFLQFYVRILGLSLQYFFSTSILFLYVTLLGLFLVLETFLFGFLHQIPLLLC